jgi:hypothetical protein
MGMKMPFLQIMYCKFVGRSVEWEMTVTMKSGEKETLEHSGHEQRSKPSSSTAVGVPSAPKP